MKKTNIRVHRNGGSKPASLQVPNKPESPDPANPWRSEGFNEYDEPVFLDHTVQMMGWRPNAKTYETLSRDAAGKILLTRNVKGVGCFFKEVDFDEACAWLKTSGQQHPPEKFLALHGITRNPAPKIATPKMDLEDAVGKSAALTALLLSHLANPERENYTAHIKDVGTFNFGLMKLCGDTSAQLLEAFYEPKGGVQ